MPSLFPRLSNQLVSAAVALQSLTATAACKSRYRRCGFNLQIHLSPLADTLTVWPGRISPLRSFTASGF